MNNDGQKYEITDVMRQEDGRLLIVIRGLDGIYAAGFGSTYKLALDAALEMLNHMTTNPPRPKTSPTVRPKS